MYPLEGKYEQRPPMLEHSPDKSLVGMKRTAEKSVENLEATVLQYKSDGSGNKDLGKEGRKRDRKKLKKLKENSIDGFISCDTQDGINELVLS